MAFSTDDDTLRTVDGRRVLLLQLKILLFSLRLLSLSPPGPEGHDESWFSSWDEDAEPSRLLAEGADAYADGDADANADVLSAVADAAVADAVVADAARCDASACRARAAIEPWGTEPWEAEQPARLSPPSTSSC